MRNTLVSRVSNATSENLATKNLFSRLKESIAVLGISLLPYISGCNLPPNPVTYAGNGQTVVTPIGGWKDFNNNGIKDAYEFIDPGKKIFYPGENIAVLLSHNDAKSYNSVEQIVQYSLFDEKSNTYVPCNKTYEKLPAISIWKENRCCQIEIPEEYRDKSLKVEVSFFMKGLGLLISFQTNLSTSFLYNPPVLRETSIPKQNISP